MTPALAAFLWFTVIQSRHRKGHNLAAGGLMIRTILVSDYIQVQGAFVRASDDGNIVVCTGEGKFEGRPIGHLGKKPSSHVVLAVS